MAVSIVRGGNWTLNVDQQMIDVTMEHPTFREDWRFTDVNGHDHFYERGQYDAFPTLNYIVDAEHWCDGREGLYSHDPHLAVDEAHYECKLCGVAVVPAMYPGGWPRQVPGQRSATLHGFRSDGWQITAWLTEDEVNSFRGDSVNVDEVAQHLLDTLPDDRIFERTFTAR